MARDPDVLGLTSRGSRRTPTAQCRRRCCQGELAASLAVLTVVLGVAVDACAGGATATDPLRLAAAALGIPVLNAGRSLALDASLRAFSLSLSIPALVVYLAASALGPAAQLSGSSRTRGCEK